MVELNFNVSLDDFMAQIHDLESELKNSSTYKNADANLKEELLQDLDFTINNAIENYGKQQYSKRLAVMKSIKTIFNYCKEKQTNCDPNTCILHQIFYQSNTFCNIKNLDENLINNVLDKLK